LVARTPLYVKVLWILVAALFSVVIAFVAGILVSTTGATLAEAALKAGSAFVASMVLCLAVLSALGAIDIEPFPSPSKEPPPSTAPTAGAASGEGGGDALMQSRGPGVVVGGERTQGLRPVAARLLLGVPGPVGLA